MPFDHIDWKLAIDLYHAEKLEEAHELALDTGMGQATQYLTWYRLIEAEYLTSARSSVLPLGEPFEDFELEYVPDEAGEAISELQAVAQSSFRHVGEKIGYRHDSPTRLTVLAAETDAPWLDGRYGYCIQKKPFYKICIPLTLLDNPPLLTETLHHEYAHVAVGTMADRRAPRWLNEAVAQAISGEARPALSAPFRSGKAEWLEPHELEAAFSEFQGSRRRSLAYAQAALIGAYLQGQYGDSKVGDLLRGFADNSVLKEIWIRLRGMESVEEALLQTFSMGIYQLFEHARNWAVGDEGAF